MKFTFKGCWKLGRSHLRVPLDCHGVVLLYAPVANSVGLTEIKLRRDDRLFFHGLELGDNGSAHQPSVGGLVPPPHRGDRILRDPFALE